MAFENNPWSEEFWNLTEQGRYIQQFGVEVAKTKARKAGTVLGALKPRPVPIFTRNFIVIKKIGDDGGGAQGTSGTGPPV